MLPANVVNALQTLANSAKPPLALDNNVPAAISKLETGQQLQASVLSKLGEGLFKVQLAGQTMQMRLPGNIQSGDTIKLQVVSVQPRITFSMMASTNPLSTPDQIGDTARLLSNLTDRPIERPLVQQMGSKAVWAATLQAPDVRQLATGLHDALSKSGLFYESHQAQWVRGERSINQLLEEPQNLLTGKSLTLSPGDTQQSAQDKLAAAQPSQPSAKSDNAPLIAKELQPLVQQQLHTLENHHMVWMGQVWPEQQMQWEIKGEPKHQGRQQDERQWSTEMELSLPKLGDVRARLVFAESGLRLTLHAADAATTALFNRSLPQLKNSLDNAGIALTAAIVEKP
ncbi:MAG TPA: flagellar hook-length control protein FliK [Gallionella sp.]|nr:flagellar hook-length control protein FliK [Gallionella sp.]